MDYSALRKKPDRVRWENELKNGWTGPDGSSLSSDHIMGIRIGNSNPDFRFADMPANLHDFRYAQGRRLKLPKKFRYFADVEYREGCIQAIQARLDGRTMISVGVVRAWMRYFALRIFGAAFW